MPGLHQDAFVTALTDVDTTARDTLGVIREDTNKSYKYVQFGATRTGQLTAALALGDIACYVLGTTADLDLLTLVDSANSAIGAGMVLATVPVTGGPYFGWIQVRGVATLGNAVGESGTAGDMITTAGASAKTVDKRVTLEVIYGQVVDANVSAAPIVILDFPRG